MDNNERKHLTALKSYLEFEVDGNKRTIYSISDVEKSHCNFIFNAEKAGAYEWHLNRDFAIKVTDISCVANKEIALTVEHSMDAREIIARFHLDGPTRVVISCCVHAMSTKESLQELKREYGNRVAHIDYMIQYERDLQKELANKEGECQQLREKEKQYLHEIEAAYESRAYRLGNVFARVARLVVPKNSKRALLAKLLVTFIKHPGKFLRQINMRNIKLALRLLRNGDLEGIKWRMGNQITGVHLPPSIEVIPPDVVLIDMEAEKKKTAKDYPVLSIPKWENPLVSIVIPVYNQFAYTYACVQSILKNSGDISYEILIANDCSTDLTTEIEQIMPGVKLVTTEKNVRFLLNCNNAAKYATGKYILFLNNDTQVMENWLEPLVSLIESQEDIGMVGSKLIYPDGRLQEAGGILWKDGSAWNYGNLQNPQLPEFNYVKPVDYVSGAAIMLYRSLWEEVGGFDELFAPAYYEDVDLAFKVRDKGYRVMFQPKSVVVHFEGVSNGTDTSSGLKAYQVENGKKFYKKWKDVLKEHPENAVDVFTARDRSYGRKTVLMIDHYVPMFDKDAGSRMIYQYIKLLVNMGYNVKFIGDNFLWEEPYTSALEQIGVEVLYGAYYAQNWKQWVMENSSKLDVVFMNRPHISETYIDFVKENTNAKIIYSLCDLHFLREEREYQITRNEVHLKESKQWKKRELALIKKADRAFSVSADEVKILDGYFEKGKVVQCPIFVYDEFMDKLPDRKNTQDLLFVGGFGHAPNVDAMEWFCAEVFPLIQKEIPGVRLHIAGSNPPEKIKKLASEIIIVEGFVSDEKLAQLYDTCRVDVIPLRFGAGVKGKTIEAMYKGIPIVSTSIGIEGLPKIENYITAQDNAEAFAAEVVRLYLNEECDMVNACYEYVREFFSEEAGKTFFAREFA